MQIKKILIGIIVFWIIIVMFSSKSMAITYNDATNIIQETMKSYYMKGTKIQYNFSRAGYYKFSPEEATSQERNFLVCTDFTYSVYKEAFGLTYVSQKNESDGIIYSNNVLDEAEIEYQKIADNAVDKDVNGKSLIWYATQNNIKNYIYGKKNENQENEFENLTEQVTVEEFAKLIKPGDVFAYTGHALIAYKVMVNPNTGKTDVLLLNSVGGSKIITRSYGTSSIYYNFTKPISSANNCFFNIEREGTIRARWLSTVTEFVNEGYMSCGTSTGASSIKEAAVIRIFNADENGNAVFSNVTDENQILKSKLRTEYPDLNIEKTVSAGDNNTVHLGDELKYTIKITNNSNLEYKRIDENEVNPVNITYGKFYVEEIIDDKTTYLTSTGIKNGNTIRWEIEKLQAGESVELEYTVKVNEENECINSVINSVGKFYKDDLAVFISTGTVQNTILRKKAETTDTYENIFNKYKNTASGLELINNVCNEALGINCELDKFSFDKVIKVNLLKEGDIDYDYPRRVTGIVTLNNDSKTNNVKYLNMVYNNYYNALVAGKQKGMAIEYFPKYYGSDDTRKTQINMTDFEEGDVLIYSMSAKCGRTDDNTKENGIYAYIYINGKFVGKNYEGEANERNEYTSSYYTSQPSLSSSELQEDVRKRFYSAYVSETNYSASTLENINYEQLFGKNYYVILRPSLALEKNAINIEILQNPAKINYVEGENINLEGGKIKVYYSDGSEEILEMTNKNITVTGYDKTKIGTQTITIKYENFATTLDVTNKGAINAEIGKENCIKIDSKNHEMYVKLDGNSETNENLSKLFSYINFNVDITSFEIYTYSGEKKYSAEVNSETDFDNDFLEVNFGETNKIILYNEENTFEYKIHQLGNLWHENKNDNNVIDINDVIKLRQAVLGKKDVLNNNNFEIECTDVNFSNSELGTLGDIGDIISIRRRILECKWYDVNNE